MQSLALPALLLASLLLLAAGQSPKDFGNQDINSALRDNQLVQRQIKCVLDQGPCDQLGNMLKTIIPEVLNNNCAKCSSRQASNARALVNFIKSRHPQVWTMVVARYQG